LVPEEVKKEVAKRQRKEKGAAVTPRSDEPIDFTTFGELGEIIKLTRPARFCRGSRVPTPWRVWAQCLSRW